MMKHLALLFTLLLFASASGQVEFFKLTNKEGTEIEAQIIAIDPHGVRIQLRNGRTFVVPKQTFSPESQKLIDEWKASVYERLVPDSRYEIRVSVKKDKSEIYHGYDYVYLTPEVLLQNREFDKHFKDLEGVIIILVEQDANSDIKRVYSITEFQMEVPAGRESRYSGRRPDHYYIDYESSYSDYGEEYSGYILLIRNNADELVIKKSTRSTWLAKPEALWKAAKENATETILHLVE